MDLRDLEVNKYTASIWYEMDHIEFIIDFIWNFVSFDEESNDCIVDVTLEKGEQWINGVCHDYKPNTDELREIITAIENSILEDPERFDVMEWEEGNRDFYKDLNNDRDDY